MKRILIYLVLSGAVAVLAQQQLASLQDPAGSAAGATGQAADNDADEATDSETAAGQDTSGEATQSGEQVSPDAQAGPAETPDGAELAPEDLAPEDLDSDFEPTEEISEDYPVPLPSDI